MAYIILHNNTKRNLHAGIIVKIKGIERKLFLQKKPPNEFQNCKITIL
jgi:hypothetical protein